MRQLNVEDKWNSAKGRDPSIFVRAVLDIHPTSGNPKSSKSQRQLLTTKMYQLPVSYTETLTFQDAQQIIDIGLERKRRKLCTLPQARELWAAGLRHDLTFRQASEVIRTLRSNNWNSDHDLVQVAGYQRTEPTLTKPIRRKPKATVDLSLNEEWHDKCSHHVKGLKVILNASVFKYEMNISTAQREQLTKLRLPKMLVDSLGYGSAKLILDACERRAKQGLCSFAMAFSLWELGFPYDVSGSDGNSILQKLSTAKDKDTCIQEMKKELGIMTDVRNERTYFISDGFDHIKGEWSKREVPPSWFRDPEYTKVASMPLYERPRMSIELPTRQPKYGCITLLSMPTPKNTKFDESYGDPVRICSKSMSVYNDEDIDMPEL